MVLDFKEIPPANSNEGLQDTFELFARDFLNLLGFRICDDPYRGADGGKDIIVEELISGIVSNTSIKWLVSCKHYAHTGKSVTDKDELNISERIKQHKCNGFIGFYSTVMSTGLSGLLKGIDKSIIYDHEKIENIILSKGLEGHKLATRFFPNSFKRYQIEYPEPAEIFTNQEPILCESCKKNLLLEKEHGNFVCVKLPPIYDEKDNNLQSEKIKDIYFTCKDCDSKLEQKYRRLGYSDAGWEDIDDLCIPLIWIKELMAFINGIQEKQDLDNKAFEKMKQMFLKTYPYVARNLTTKEKKRVKDLLDFDLL